MVWVAGLERWIGYCGGAVADVRGAAALGVCRARLLCACWVGIAERGVAAPDALVGGWRWLGEGVMGSQPGGLPLGLLCQCHVDVACRGRGVHPPHRVGGAGAARWPGRRGVHVWLYDGGAGLVHARREHRAAPLGAVAQPPRLRARWVCGQRAFRSHVCHRARRVPAVSRGRGRRHGRRGARAPQHPPGCVCVGVLLGMAVRFCAAAWGWMATFHTGRK